MEEHPLKQVMDRAMEERERFFLDAFVALTINGISGDYVEFGSSGALSFGQAYDVIRRIDVDRHLWAFDSFEGLPDPKDERDAHPVFGAHFGADPETGLAQFHAACDVRGIRRDAYTTVPGYFDATMAAIGPDGPPMDIALAYIDCNMYSSTVTAFEFLAPRLKHGMIVAFDDYHLWTDKEVSGERAALHEFLQAHPEWTFQPFKEVHYAGVSFVVERADALDRR
jgi:O-methyltransferase